MSESKYFANEQNSSLLTKGKEEQSGDDVHSLLEALSKYTSIDYRHIIALSKLHRWLFGTTAGFFVLALLLALGARMFEPIRRPLVPVALLLLLLSQVSAGLYSAVVTVYPSIREMLQPTASFLHTEARYAQKDYNFACGISEFSENVLEFSAKRLRSQADHMKTRIAMLVGALDKVGIIPLFASGILTYWKLRPEMNSVAAAISLPMLYIIVGGILVLYVLSVIMLIVCHRIEELAQIAEVAVEQKRAKMARASNAL